MHTILLHIAGIAILEICFFFYYVGPMETQLFQKSVRLLAEEPVSKLNSLILTGQTTYPDTQLILYKLFADQSEPYDIDADRHNMSDVGKEDRDPPSPKEFANWFQRNNSVDLRTLLRDIEIVLIEAAMARNNGNTSEAARDLKLQRTTLIEKIKKYGI